MKSYFLEGLSDPLQARQALSSFLPGQSDPWILLSPSQGDAVAYINVLSTENGNDDVEGPYFIMADISGRHFNQDTIVIALLQKVQTAIGGVITDDYDNTI